MLRTITSTAVIIACLWAVCDAILGLENSWLLFLHRALAPLSLWGVLVSGFLALGLRALRTKGFVAFWGLVMIACAAPVIRSFIVSGTTALAPRLPPSNQEAALTLLNFNALGHIDRSTQIIAEIRRLAPDIVTLQEVNPRLAQALANELAQSYPCQHLDPAEGSWGMGVIAKSDCTSINLPNTDSWVGKPQMVQVHRGEKSPFLVINIHAVHPHAYLESVPCCGTITGFTQTVQAREAAISNIIAASKPIKASAVIIAGDFNSTMRNTVYEKVIRAGYKDSWLSLHGPLTGATWPGMAFIKSKLLSWLLRIDFVFHCKALRPLHAELLPESLGSDHRGLSVSFAEKT